MIIHSIWISLSWMLAMSVNFQKYLQIFILHRIRNKMFRTDRKSDSLTILWHSVINSLVSLMHSIIFFLLLFIHFLTIVNNEIDFVKITGSIWRLNLFYYSVNIDLCKNMLYFFECHPNGIQKPVINYNIFFHFWLISENLSFAKQFFFKDFK